MQTSTSERDDGLVRRDGRSFNACLTLSAPSGLCGFTEALCARLRKSRRPTEKGMPLSLELTLRRSGIESDIGAKMKGGYVLYILDGCIEKGERLHSSFISHT